MKAVLILLFLSLFTHGCTVETEDIWDDDYLVQTIVDEGYVKDIPTDPFDTEHTTADPIPPGLHQTRRSMAHSLRYNGRISYNGYLWTWYSQRVLPGYGLRIPGRHVNRDGYVADSNGYIVLASKWHAKGTILSTPLGYTGKVYDYCPEGNIDVYVDW